MDEISKCITADSLRYLSIEEMPEAVPDRENGFCMACFNGDYSVRFSETKKDQLQLL